MSREILLLLLLRIIMMITADVLFSCVFWTRLLRRQLLHFAPLMLTLTLTSICTLTNLPCQSQILLRYYKLTSFWYFYLNLCFGSLLLLLFLFFPYTLHILISWYRIIFHSLLWLLKWSWFSQWWNSTILILNFRWLCTFSYIRHTLFLRWINWISSWWPNLRYLRLCYGFSTWFL